MKNRFSSCLLALLIIFIIVAPITLSPVIIPAAQAEQPKTRSLGLGYVLLAKSGIHPAFLRPGSAVYSSELHGVISELQTNSLPIPATSCAPPSCIPANYVAIGRHEEVYINANGKFGATQRKYNLADYTSSCTGTIVSDSDYGSFLIYTFSSDVGTSSPMTVTDSWVKGLTFNTGPSLLSSGGGQPSGAGCDTTKSIFVMAVAASLPAGSGWSYSPSGIFTINVGSISKSTLYYLEFYYFAKVSNPNTSFFASKPSLLFSPSSLSSGTQYIVSSGISPFSVKPPGASWPDYVRVATFIPPWVAESGTGTWFVGADPWYWDGSVTCSFPSSTCLISGYNYQGWGVTRWPYDPPWDVTSANPIQFSWNHVYYGQLVYSGEPFGGCYYETTARVGVDFLSIGSDLLATQSSYPNNLPKAVGVPNGVRISMDVTINMGTVTDSFGNVFTVYNGVDSWVDWHARTPAYTTSTSPEC
ncbi:MAG TPA: hypothetical protein VEG61_08115 [Candidatus Dormibacteraeota bacterium]|nr:hypothetical protein [Candidatus Dormibacteraeota bacterium]